MPQWHSDTLYNSIEILEDSVLPIIWHDALQASWLTPGNVGFRACSYGESFHDISGSGGKLLSQIGIPRLLAWEKFSWQARII